MSDSSTKVGNFYVIAAPSGGGKTSLVAALVENLDDIKVSISYTTRQIRPGEEDGVNYQFVDDQQFNKMVADKQFLEHADVFGHQYGTAKHWVMDQLAKGRDVILEIDWQGARQIRQLFPSTISIYILPPSIQVLARRLAERKQDNEEIIAKRMQLAQEEISHYHEFDYVIVNDQFDAAVEDIISIVRSNRLKTVVQREKLQSLLAELLKNQ